MAYFRDVAAMPRLALELLARYELDLSAHVRAKFAERASEVRLYGHPASAVRLPVFAFNVDGVPSEELAHRFELANIEARLGDYYTPRLMQRLAPEAGGQAVRLSFSHYNTYAEVDRCFDVIDAALGRRDAAAEVLSG
jgi:selenocysteine lyase/cysteine desulfurase